MEAILGHLQRGGAPGAFDRILATRHGTHGDDIPGDGIYHFRDPDQNIGCHGVNAPPGEYHYSFWSEDVYGQRSNTASISITRR